MTAYLDVEDALQVVDRYGFHISDVGLLASALARPATTVMGAKAYPELAVKAAALLESVARFHPLIVGNKRTAWTLMVLLLWINGYRFRFCQVDRHAYSVRGARAPDVWGADLNRVMKASWGCRHEVVDVSIVPHLDRVGPIDLFSCALLLKGLGTGDGLLQALSGRRVACENRIETFADGCEGA